MPPRVWAWCVQPPPPQVRYRSFSALISVSDSGGQVQRHVVPDPTTPTPARTRPPSVADAEMPGPEHPDPLSPLPEMWEGDLSNYYDDPEQPWRHRLAAARSSVKALGQFYGHNLVDIARYYDSMPTDFSFDSLSSMAESLFTFVRIFNQLQGQFQQSPVFPEFDEAAMLRINRTTFKFDDFQSQQTAFHQETQSAFLTISSSVTELGKQLNKSVWDIRSDVTSICEVELHNAEYQAQVTVD